MTKIADIYDAIVVKVETVLPTFKRIPNPYEIDENSAILMRKAYGLAIGAGSNTERYVGCFVTWERSYTLAIMTQVVNTENDTTGRAMVEKDLVDSHRDLLLAFEQDSTLGGEVIKAVVTDDSGIEYLTGENGKFLAIEISISVEYQEPVN